MSSAQALRNYLLGGVNILIVTALAGLLGVLLIFQIKAYELNVSFSFSPAILWYDPFATILLLLIVVALIFNTLSAVVMFSGMYPHTIESNALMLSLSSLVWILIFVAVDNAWQNPAFLPLVLLMCSLVILIAYQLRRLRLKIILLIASGVVVVTPILSHLID